ncbi:MAG TPA: hypothetical protein VHZ52_11495 [Acidobacteriaceae bacterium]|jgi:hypothetical protein|nr:hypothetical protein [Acidobacteriaceae bacterium]
MEVKVSAKALAEFAVGGPSKKAQVVRTITRPESAEAKVITHYYSKAVNVIRVYHSRDNDPVYLATQLDILENDLLEATTPQSRANIRNNIRVIETYMELYGDLKRQIIARPRISFRTDEVRVSASPDMAIIEAGKTVLVKLGPNKKPLDPDAVRIILRLIYQAAADTFQISPQDIVYLDIKNSASILGGDEDSMLASTIDNACHSLALMCRN